MGGTTESIETMSLRRMLLFAVVVLGLLWAADTWRVRAASQRLGRASGLMQQAFPPEPVQQATQAASFTQGEYRIEPVAEFSLRARILGRENYHTDRESDLSPMDLALGWNRMAEPAVYEALNITQGGRWYRYFWPDQPPIPVQEIIASSANMHMIAANKMVRQALEQARSGRFIRLQGKLVNVQHPSGWQWRSSLVRTDSGAGSCELVYVESALVE